MKIIELFEVVNPRDSLPLKWKESVGIIKAKADPMNWAGLYQQRNELKAQLSALTRRGQNAQAIEIQDKVLPQVEAEMKVARNEMIDISFASMGNTGIIQISFERGHSHAVTGGGKAAQILSTVVAAIKEYLSKHHPEYIYFSAKGGSRSSLYLALTLRLGQEYKLISPVEYSHDMRDLLSAWKESDEAQFLLKRT
jgi:hypothetical protein